MDEVDLDGEPRGSRPAGSAPAPRWTPPRIVAVVGVLVLAASVGGLILHEQDRGRRAMGPAQPSVQVQLDSDRECDAAGQDRDVLTLECGLRVRNTGSSPLELVGVESTAPGVRMSGSGEGQLVPAGRHADVVMLVKVTCAVLPPVLPTMSLRLDVITSDHILRPSSAPLRVQGTSLAKSARRRC
jgi:hypothetical protein